VRWHGEDLVVTGILDGAPVEIAWAAPKFLDMSPA
jgi:hypothetical protein